LGPRWPGGPTIRDIRNIRKSGYAHANFDVRHRFVYSFLYELPFGRGKRYPLANAVTNAILGNWQVNGILTLQTGFPRNITSTFVSMASDARTADLVPGKNPNNPPPGGRTPEEWFDTSAVVAPALGTAGNLAPMAIFALGTRNLDLSLFKRFPIKERYAVTYRAEFFNLANTPQFDPLQMSLVQGGGGFGRVTGTISGSQRHVQFALRFEF